MNRVQKAIASVTGMRDEARAVESMFAEASTALEQATHVQALIEIRIDELTYAGYQSQSREIVLNQARDPVMIRRLRVMRQENPLAKQAMKLVLRFVLGRGLDYLVPDDRAKEIWESFWNDMVNQIGYCSHDALKERLDEALTDGENFFICATTPGVAPYVRLAKIPMEEIVDTVTDPGNANIPLYYKRQFVPMVYDASLNAGLGGWVEQFTGSQRIQTKYYADYRIPQTYLDELSAKGLIRIPKGQIDDQKMKHRYLNPLWFKAGKRGLSELFSSREWFKVYREFMEARAQINEAASAFSYVRKKKAGATGVASMTGRIGQLDLAQGNDLATTGDTMARATRPLRGAIYDTTEDVDLTTIRADTGAQDALSDGRSLLQSAGAGVGTMMTYFGDGGDANLATAQTMELPMVKMYEEYQEWLENDLTETYLYVLKVALDAEEYGDIPEEMLIINWDMPPIVAKDVTKYITAWAQLTQQIAPGNIALQEVAIKGGLVTMDVPNVDAVMPLIMEEQQKIQARKEEQQQMQMDAMKNGMLAGPPGGPPGQKPPPQDGQKAGDGGYTPGQSPDTIRAEKGKPPREMPTGPRSRRT